MTRRITIPDNHVALILPVQLADELMSLCTFVRRYAAGPRSRIKDGAPASEADGDKIRLSYIAGDVLLALLEAKEA